MGPTEPEPWDYSKLAIIGTMVLVVCMLVSQAKEPIIVPPIGPSPVVQPDRDPNCPDGRCPYRKPHVSLGGYSLDL